MHPRLCPALHSYIRAPLIALLLVMAMVGFLPSAGQAQEPEGRPYIELPFPQGTRYRITCGYDCYQHRGSMMYAVDFSAPEGDPILAAADGEVMAVTWEVGLPRDQNLGDALIIYISHGNGWFTRYIHLQGVTVAEGDVVEMGDVIGYSGKTGAAGAHLHFELKYGTSLHSPSVPIDELFDGQPPQAGDRFESNNRSLTEAEAAPLPSATATETPALAPLVPTATTATTATMASPPMAVTEPAINSGIELSTQTVQVDEPFTVTFMVQNPTTIPLPLTMLGVGARDSATGELITSSFVFDSNLTLQPGESYRFEAAETLDMVGTIELFVFGLGASNEWVRFGGEGQVTAVTVTQPDGPTTIYLPFVMSDTPAPRPTAPPSRPATTTATGAAGSSANSLHRAPTPTPMGLDGTNVQLGQVPR